MPIKKIIDPFSSPKKIPLYDATEIFYIYVSIKETFSLPSGALLLVFFVVLR